MNFPTPYIFLHTTLFSSKIKYADYARTAHNESHGSLDIDYDA